MYVVKKKNSNLSIKASCAAMKIIQASTKKDIFTGNKMYTKL